MHNNFSNINMTKVAPHEKYIPLPSDEDRLVNDNFLQMYKDHIPVIRKVIKESPQAAEMLFWMMENMNDRNALIVSQQALAEAMDCHRNTINNHIRYLKEMKAIYTLKSGSSNIYYLNKEIVWQDNAHNKRFGKFGATIVVAESEQEPDFKAEILPILTAKKRPGRPRNPVAIQPKITSKPTPKPTANNLSEAVAYSSVLPGIDPVALAEFLSEQMRKSTADTVVVPIILFCFTSAFFSLNQAVNFLLS
jgi:hypothetical protein